MVMARNAMGVNLRQSIIKSLGRYIAIVLIIALGSGLFVGLLMTKSDMVLTGQEYTDEMNMFDLRFISTYGWEEAQVELAAAGPGITGAEGVLYADFIAAVGSDSDVAVYRFYSIPQKINKLNLVSGRFPESAGECLADAYFFDESSIGTTVVLSPENDADSLVDMNQTSFTIVGLISSPLYMDMNRGTTSVGGGSLESYFYLPEDAFDMDYYTELHITIPGENLLYSDAYHGLMEAEVERLESFAEELAMERFLNLKSDAMEEYQDGYQEYLDGVAEYEEGLREFNLEIADAYKELEDGEKELESARRKLNLSQKDLETAEAQLESGGEEIKNYETQLSQQKAGLQAQIADIENNQIPAVQAQLNSLDGTGLTEEEFAALKQPLEAQLAGLYTKKGTYQHMLDVTIPSALKQIEDKKAEIAKGWQEVHDGYAQIVRGWAEFNKGRKELDEGWAELEEGIAEGKQELADAQQELSDAQKELQDALWDILELEEPDVFVLDRTSNIGYNSLDSASDIVASVSRILPVFFLLIASLVCITTMTRMVEEERTQIGTLKALGYSNSAIISKYLIYAGSGAILGCGVGVWAGSMIFPTILWDAYKIMLCVREDVAISFNWWLCGIVVFVYTAVILFVTWYCCKKALREVPAELIRPKAPDPGKQLLIEKIPLWNRLSFLNKVMVRNIFRYKQRLAMMLVGIGGCTALLVTGFGLRDSIVGVVDYQFENVTIYDLEVNFKEHQPPEMQKTFLEDLGENARNVLFFHQSSVDLEFGGVTKELYMICSDDTLTDFIHMYSENSVVSLPQVQEVVLSSGVADALDIAVGDTVLLRNADMQMLELVVSGIYENHVYNYAIVAPQTIENNWGDLPEQQMAYIQIAPDVDTHGLSAEISGFDTAMNVSVSEDMAAMVGRMMQALDLIVVVVVFCAGLLATIVLYNLTNININERIREIATIKVLGFNAAETGAYVFKENLTLTIIGSLVGLLMGELLLLFVMNQVKIDLVWFKTIILPMSYIWSFVLTLVASFVVDFLFYFKLDKINMAEALKSVE